TTPGRGETQGRTMDPQQAMTMAMMAMQGGGQQPPLQRMFSAQPMFGGVPMRMDQMFDLSGLPGLGGPQGQLMAMAMQTALPGLMGPNFQMGQFMPTQNLFDHRMA